jgi:hypothetical protein
MSRDAKAESRAINAILWKDWDPIGAGAPKDEYWSYVWPVYKLLIEGASGAEIGVYLRRAAQEQMQIPSPEERLNHVVDKLLALKLAKSEVKQT